MRSIAVFSVFTSLLLAGSAYAQRPTEAGPCAAPSGPSIERLQDLARLYHPEALSAAKSQAFVLIAFVLNADCRVLQHTTGQRAGEHIDLETTLRSLFPDLGRGPFVPAGIADATTDPAPGRPWIVWTLVQS